MDAQLKTKWIEALRGGGYLQVEGMLRDSKGGEFGYCCLGVLCVVAGADWTDGLPFLDGTIWQRDDEELLSGEALRIAGLRGDTQGTLAEMNDSGKPFTEIADYIEQNL